MTTSASSPSTLASEFVVLVETFRRVTDPRKARGKVHPLPGLASVSVLGLMAGHASLQSIARWAARQPQILPCLGLQRAPSTATLWRMLQYVSVAEVREALATFAATLHRLRCVTPDAPSDPDAPRDLGAVTIALDGKTLRGVSEAGTQLHVLHAFASESALVLDQVELAGHFQEPAVAEAWLTRLTERFPAFEILTGDALYAEQSLCAAIVAAEKHYVVKVKKTNPPCSPTFRNSSPTPVIPT